MRVCKWSLCFVMTGLGVSLLMAQPADPDPPGGEALVPPELSLAQEVPLMPAIGPMASTAVAEGWRWRLQAADAALAEGFSSLAAGFYQDVLDDPGLNETAVAPAQLNLATALLASGELEQAAAVLATIGAEDPGLAVRVALRRAWLTYLEGRPTAAARLVRDFRLSQLPATDYPWGLVLTALLRHADGEYEEANALFDEALEAAPSEGLRNQFELLRLRGELVAGEPREEVVTELRMTARALEGQVGEAEASRLLAVALARLGRGDEALEVIEQELQRPGIVGTPRRFDFLLLLSLIAGDESGRGRLSLRQILSGDAEPATQRIALSLLAQAPFQGPFRNEFLVFLGELIGDPEQSPLLDEFLGTRALLHALDRNFVQAEADALRLVEQFPGSDLFAEMHRLLAYVNWSREPPRYRTAASYVNQLREFVDDPTARARLTVLMGDCYFLNGDYLNASDAYGSALREPDIQRRGEILFQRVLSEVRAGRLGEAERILDESAGVVAMDAGRRWQAEWNLLNARRDAGQTAEAFNRLRSLLSQVGTQALTPELEVRVRWLEARLTLEAGRPSETPGLVDALLERVEEVPPEALSSSDRAAVASHALLVKGEALLALGQRSEALAVFANLRTRFPDSGPDMLSYLIEARLAASENSIVEAQSSLINLADRFPESRYAPIALWEAALQVEQRGLDSSYREAISILERLLREYPESPLVYFARLKQADLSRLLNDFGTALVLYERILAEYPEHPDRYRAELSRADCLLARGSARADSLVAASVVYERLLLDPGVPLDAQIEAGFKWGIALRQRELPEGARRAFYTVKQRGLDDPERAVRLGAQGRYWMARTLLELGSLQEAMNTLEGFAHARDLYRQLIAANLPGQEVARSRLDRLQNSAG